jgi:hypothetical protein
LKEVQSPAVFATMREGKQTFRIFDERKPSEVEEARASKVGGFSKLSPMISRPLYTMEGVMARASCLGGGIILPMEDLTF